MARGVQASGDLALWGVPYAKLDAAVDRATEERLLRIRAAMECRWPGEFLNPKTYMDIARERSLSELAAMLLYGSIRSELARMAGERRHLANPVRVQERPMRLKRAVSAREFIDVLERGSVTGRLNAWHRGDPRKLVMWGGEGVADRLLLTQSEDLHRQAEVVLSKEMGIALAHDAVPKSQKQAWMDAEVRRREKSGWTSAVLLTVPVSGSMVWPSGNRDNLMGNMDEHGLPPGRITTRDIAAVRLYREKECVFEGDLVEVSAMTDVLTCPADHDEVRLVAGAETIHPEPALAGAPAP